MDPNFITQKVKIMKDGIEAIMIPRGIFERPRESQTRLRIIILEDGIPAIITDAIDPKDDDGTYFSLF